MSTPDDDLPTITAAKVTVEVWPTGWRNPFYAGLQFSLGAVWGVSLAVVFAKLALRAFHWLGLA